MDTIMQKTANVPVVGKTITVRRMRWKAARQFSKMLAGAFKTAVREGSLGQFVASKEGVQIGDIIIADGGIVAKAGAFTGIAQIIEAMITQSDEMATHLVTSSTDLSADEFDDLDTVSALTLVTKALEINFDAETKNCFAGLAGALAALMPATPKAK